MNSIKSFSKCYLTVSHRIFVSRITAKPTSLPTLPVLRRYAVLCEARRGPLQVSAWSSHRCCYFQRPGQEDSTEDTKETNDWGDENERDGGRDRSSNDDSGSLDIYSRNTTVLPGDWKCPSCQFNNFASRMACFKCRTPKDGVSPAFSSGERKGGGRVMRDMRPGDWSCPKCQFHNFSSRDMCYKCNSPRDDMRSGAPSADLQEGGRSDGPRGDMRAGDWQCQQCQCHNFSFRDKCFKCFSPK